MSQNLSVPEFTRNYIANLQPGDVAFHGMLFPGVYPGAQEAAWHEEALNTGRVRIEVPFLTLCRQLVAKQVKIQWLRMTPREGSFGYNERDVLAMQAGAAAIAETSGADVRIADFGYVANKLAHRGVPLSTLHQEYMTGAAQHIPRASFWRIDTRNDPANPTVSVMNYKHSGAEKVFAGHDIHIGPLAPELHEYTDFWRDIYQNHAIPTTAFNVPREAAGQ